jgi:hypothetical protein
MGNMKISTSELGLQFERLNLAFNALNDATYSPNPELQKLQVYRQVQPLDQ